VERGPSLGGKRKEHVWTLKMMSVSAGKRGRNKKVSEPNTASGGGRNVKLLVCLKRVLVKVPKKGGIESLSCGAYSIS